MSCDDCLSRRQFLMKSTLAAAGAAAVVSGCGDGQIGASRVAGPVGVQITIKVSTLTALATSGKLAILPSDRRIAVKRTGANTFVAMSTVCTHEGTLVELSNNAFQCPNHGARYDAEGKVTRQPDSGSATTLPRYTTSYNAATDILTIVA
ncbi:MAG: Rieske [2Fe-2S] iron-sulfur protein [Gemmatimonadetes bacterium]|nr:Rieske [2Fe-2S] iron-sulfur protein [Gemmatimonadota bacterium]